MGKFFGISDNPVSTIESALKPLRLEAPKYTIIKPSKMLTEDKFVSNQKSHVSNPIVKMRNGFGKLMSHFSHPKTKA